MEDLDKILTEDLSLNDKEIDKFKSLVSKNKSTMFKVLAKHSSVDTTKLLKAFSKFYKVNSVEIEKAKFHYKVLSLVPKELATKENIIAFEKAGNTILVAIADPGNKSTLDKIKKKTGLSVNPILALEDKIKEVIKKAYIKETRGIKISEKDFTSTTTERKERTVIGKTSSDSGPVITLVDDIIKECISRKASDIHIEPYEKSLRVRLRVDGSLFEIVSPPIGMKNALISRVKIMSGLNITETRLPQDGSINIEIEDRAIDFRVNTLPTAFGEKLVMRVLDKSNLQVDMQVLGFDNAQLSNFQKAIHYSNGIVLVTGPTGSGKTTTLYSALQELNTLDRNIMTSEDPVEYSLEGINQVQIKPAIGLDFSATLRSFLRQDPDIIMVGEIRDIETAEIAIKAALTGHLVLSTLHTNSATDTLSRLLNMGVAAFNLVAALKCITAQRLIRLICTECKKEDESFDKQQLIEVGIPEKHIPKIKIFNGEGCSSCNQSGYSGRVAVHEVLLVKEEIKNAILNNLSAMELKKIAMRLGMITLRQSALKKMITGETTFSEVLRITDDDRQ
jgi:type IV pilus assembly protein PilB